MVDKVHKLHFWCQKVLPLVYDDALSYYELLAKVVKHLNDNTDAINVLIDFYEKFDEEVLQDLETIVQELIEDGSLDPVIADTIGGLIALPYVSDGTKTYHPYDYCIYNGSLYKCKSDTSGNWSSSKWDETLVCDEIKALKRLTDPYKIVLISDSYGEDATAGGKSWETFVQEKFPNKSIVKYARGSGAFGYPDTTNIRYLPNFFGSLPSDNQVDLVFMLFGANDGNLIENGSTDATTIKAGIAASKTVLTNKYPNAKLVLGFAGNTNTEAKKTYYHAARVAYEQGCSENKIVYAYNFNYVLNNPTLISSDHVHPTLTGSGTLGNAAIQYIMNGDIDPFDYYFLPKISSQIELTYASEGSVTNNTCFKVGNTVCASLRQTSISKTGSYFIIGTLPEGFRPPENLLCPVILIFGDNGFKIANAHVRYTGVIDLQPLSNLEITEWLFQITFPINS